MWVHIHASRLPSLPPIPRPLLGLRNEREHDAPSSAAHTDLATTDAAPANSPAYVQLGSSQATLQSRGHASCCEPQPPGEGR